MKTTIRTQTCGALLALALAAAGNASAITTNFFANFQSATAGSISDATVLNGGTALGTWSLQNLDGTNTGVGAMSLSGGGNQSAVFAHNGGANPIPNMPFELTENTVVDASGGVYPFVVNNDAGHGTLIFAEFATPGQFTGTSATHISWKWGIFGTGNSGNMKYQFVRGLDAANNEVFELLLVGGSGNNNRQVFIRGAFDETTTLYAANNGTPAGIPANNFLAGTINSTTVGTDPAELLKVDVILTNNYAEFVFSHSTISDGVNSNVLSFPFQLINSAATTISRLEFSAGWNTNCNTQNKGFWIDDVIVTDAPLPDPRTYQWAGQINNLWDIGATANWTNLLTGLPSTYADTAPGGVEAVFNDNAVSSSVNVSTTVSPDTMTFSNNALAYTLGGSGKISGPLAVTVSAANTVTISNANDYTGTTLLNSGRVRMANDNALGASLIQLNGGALSSDGATPRSIANALLISSASILGDVTDSGTLAFSQLVTFGKQARTLTNDSEVVFAGGANDGRINAKYGSGTLTLQGNVEFNGACDIRGGTLIIDGASFTNSDRLRPEAVGATVVARIVITNGGSVTLNGTGNNLVVGANATAPGTNIVDLAGLFSTPNANDSNGEVRMETVNSLHSELNVLPGGDYTTRAVRAVGTGSSPTLLNFNGGILRARQDHTAFLEGLTSASIRTGGAIIDDGGFAITIAQDLLNGGGGGGLTKIGAGTLTLAGNNNAYTGPTVVSEGTLEVKLPSSSGSVSLAAGTQLGFTVGNVAGATWSLPTLTLPGSNALSFSYAADSVPPSGAMVTVPTLDATGEVLVEVGGSGWPVGTTTLLNYGSLSGSPTFTLAPLPLGLGGYLTNNPTTTALELVVTYSANTLYWYGYSATSVNPPFGGLWDIATSLNWSSPAGSFGNTTYQEYAGGTVGDFVIFDSDESANLAVELTTPVKPAAVTVSNPGGGATDFTFAGPGKISGGSVLTKTRDGNLTLNQAHDYTGGTFLQQGSVTLGVGNALPVGGVVTLGSPGQGASLVLNGFSQTLAGLVAGGSGSGSRRVYNGSATPVILTFDTPAGTDHRYSHTLGNDTVTDGDNFSIVKNGAGEQRIGTSTYTGTTVVNAGRFIYTGNAAAATNSVTVNAGAVLGGNGIIGGPVTLNPGSALAPANDLGAANSLTLSNALTLNSGVTCLFDVDTDTLATDAVDGLTDITYAGDLVVTNIGTNAFTGGETFQLFAATGTKTGNFDSVTILPATGATGLFDPATGVLTISVGVPELTWTNLGGGVLEFFFDAASKLVWQTNALAVGLSSNWVDYPGGDTSPVSVTNNPAVPATFFGLQPK